MSVFPVRRKIITFQTVMKLKMLTVTIPGWASGSMMIQKVFIGPHPSIAAASSNVNDRFLKKLIRKKTVNGTLMQMYKKIRTPRELVIRSEVIAENSGIIIMIAGIPSAVTKRFLSSRFPRNSKRESTYAAGAETRTIPAIDERV